MFYSDFLITRLRRVLNSYTILIERLKLLNYRPIEEKLRKKGIYSIYDFNLLLIKDSKTLIQEYPGKYGMVLEIIIIGGDKEWEDNEYNFYDGITNFWNNISDIILKNNGVRLQSDVKS